MKKNKLLKFLVLSIVLLSFTISANAATATVYLRTDQSSASSSIIGLSNKADYYAANSPNSLFSVYANAYRAYPGKGWQQVAESLMSTGSSASGSLTGTEGANWYLELNPWGWGLIGCEAVGTISY
ncbi:hypothetical protein [Alkaliphilus crotonatoxidans]